MDTTTILLDLDLLIAAMEAQPDTKARQRAWDLLAEQPTVTMQGAAYRVPSATWSNTTYVATAHGCTCEARKPCWHQTYAAICDLARETAEIVAAAEREEATAFVERYVIAQANMGHTVSANDRAIVYSVSHKAAMSSGINDLF